MIEHYRCYFISRDGRARSLASIAAPDPMSAVGLATKRFPLKGYPIVEVWQRADRVLVCANPAGRVSPEPLQRRAVRS